MGHGWHARKFDLEITLFNMAAITRIGGWIYMTYKSTVHWPPYIYTYKKWTLMYWEQETHNLQLKVSHDVEWIYLNHVFWYEAIYVGPFKSDISAQWIATMGECMVEAYLISWWNKIYTMGAEKAQNLDNSFWHQLQCTMGKLGLYCKMGKHCKYTF